MPIYEYRCKYCANLEEVLQKANDPAPDQCPACTQKNGMEKAISHTSFQLKGGGWYNEGYASAKPAAACEKPGCGTVKAPCQAA
ncbi:MAG: zinc ribbon domain-containing protein [Myxococcota bacterium]